MIALTSLRSWILGLVVVVLVVFLLFAGSVLLLAWRADGPPPEHTRIPIRVDATMTADGARVVTEAWPIVRFESDADGSTRLGAYDSASDGKSQHVEFVLHLRYRSVVRRGQSSVVRPARDRDVQLARMGEAIQGTVTIDADRPPAPGDDRIVAYDLRAMRNDEPVELRGKVRVPFIPSTR